MATPNRRVIHFINLLLNRLNINVDTLTAKRTEIERLNDAVRRGWFEKPVFSVPECFLQDSAWRRLVKTVPKYEDRFKALEDNNTNDVGFRLDNEFYRSPDAEILYTIIREYRPKKVVEIGCGNSTKLLRQSISDAGYAGRIECIDPCPRLDIKNVADQFTQCAVEQLDPVELANSLNPGDVLFIDSSHHVRAANDTTFLYGAVLPRLKPGVIVHIHDVFLPWDYPSSWALDEGVGKWAENQLVHSALAYGGWVSLWPGYFLQKTQIDFPIWFPRSRNSRAQSLWIEKT